MPAEIMQPIFTAGGMWLNIRNHKFILSQEQAMASPRDPDPEKPDIIEFTPEPGTKIEKLAPLVIKAMELLDKDAEIHFPTFTLEVPRGATAQDIIDTYHMVVIEYLPALRDPPKKPPRGPGLC